MNVKTKLHAGRHRLAAVAVTAALAAIPLVACGSSDDTGATAEEVTTTAAGSDDAATDDTEPVSASDADAATESGIGRAQVELTQTMRVLWAQHMEWTYETVAAYIQDAGSDLTAASLERLLQNQQDIGDAVGMFFGDEAGSITADLLTEHIEGAVPVLDAAMAGDEGALEVAIDDWFENSKEIGETIADLNPENWAREDVVEMLHAHIEQTIAYSSDQIEGDFEQSLVDYDEAKHHMMGLADIMADGIVAAFPDEFPDDDAISPSHLELSNTLRELWHEHMEWTYATVTAYITDAGSDLTGASLERLLRNQQDLGEAIGAFFGDEAGEAAAGLLTEHIEGAVPVLDAAIAGDDAALEVAVDDWYENSAEIAAAIADLNPEHWPLETVEAMMHDHIEQTVAYAGDQIGGDHAASIVHYEEAQHHMLGLADVLADGIVAVFPEQFTD